VEPTERRLLTSDEVAAVLRRAAELDGEHDRRPDGVEYEALEAAASEVGLSPMAIRRAVAELDVGALERGPTVVAEQCVIERPLARVASDVDRSLRRQLLVLMRRDGSSSWWSSRSDPGAQVRRAFNPRGRIVLADVDELRVHLAAIEDGRSTLVRLEVDGPLEPALGWRVGVPGGTGILSAAGVAIATEPLLGLVVGLPVAIATSAALAADVRKRRRRAERAGYGLAALLAELAR
jgi:hypothetical protein